MLLSLHIENIAVIKKADIDFQGGLTVMTGETGAGKSIIIDAIGMILGVRPSKERPPKDIIRGGESYALAEALFGEISAENTRILEELGVSPDEEGMLTIRRIIHPDGRSQTKINGKSVAVSLQREVGNLLINVHGQHENQSLLNTSKHLIYLDKFADDLSLLREYRTHYECITSLKKELDELKRDDQEKVRLSDMYTYQIEDIDSAKLTPNEEEELLQRRNKIRNAEKIEKQVRIIYRALYQSEKGLSACDQLDRAGTALSQLESVVPDAVAMQEKLESYRYEIEDIALRINELLDEDYENPTAILDRIEGRLDVIAKLKRKYGNSIEDIIQFREKAAAALKEIEGSDCRIAELEKQLAEELEKARSLSAEIHRTRMAAASEFEGQVLHELSFLEMGKVRFRIAATPKEMGSDGADDIVFLIATNPGEPLKPLSKMASGGELSRIMLAMKSVLANRENTETLIFDEVDTGVSGKTSYKIGVKLKATTSSAQILCVTHSAQIAALAHHHLFISKKEVNGRIEAHVDALDKPGRIQEIARIMGGAEITDLLLDTAREMIESGERME